MKNWLHKHTSRVQQKYLMVWQHSREWNHWHGEFVLEHPSSETQRISVAKERWFVQHWAFTVETYFKNNDSVIVTQRTFHRHTVSPKYFGCPYQLSFHQSFKFTCHLSPSPIWGHNTKQLSTLGGSPVKGCRPSTRITKYVVKRFC
jgi:hypothetical protein